MTGRASVRPFSFAVDELRALVRGQDLVNAPGVRLRVCQSGAARVASNPETGLQSRCSDPRWLNQQSLNRGLARRHGSVCNVRQSGMPEEPRPGPTVLGRVHQRFTARPSGSVFLSPSNS